MAITPPSIQSLLIEMKFGETKLSTGTAFIVHTADGPHLLTNRHNATGRHQHTNKPLSESLGIPSHISVLHNGDAVGTWIQKTEPLYVDDRFEIPRWIEHPTLGPRADVIALKLTNVDGVRILPYSLASEDDRLIVGPADAVSVVGFPFGIAAGGSYAVWATGFIASEPSIDFDGLPIVLIDCRSREGQSGSPVAAYRGSGLAVPVGDSTAEILDKPIAKLIGIYSGRINDKSDLGFVWKTHAIQELVDSIAAAHH